MAAKQTMTDILFKWQNPAKSGLTRVSALRPTIWQNAVQLRPSSRRPKKLEVNPMQKTAVIIALALLTIVGGYVSLGAYKSAHDQKGQEMASSVMAAVEEVKRKSGSYPNKFDAAPSTVWGILPGPEVTYHYNGLKCFIHYDQWPLGPHHVLDCRAKEWSFED